MVPPEVCVVGEINPDLILYGLPENFQLERETLIERFRVTLGSSSAIFAHNLSALGTRVGMCSKTGKDVFGEMSLGWLREAGVDVSKVRMGSDTGTGVTVILANQNGRFILTYPGSMFELRFEDLDLTYIFSARHLHLSSYFLHKALRPRIVELFRTAKQRGLTTSLDTNDDPSGEWGEEVPKLLEFVDVFLPNEYEARRIARVENLFEALRILTRVTRLVVVKRGSKGAIAYDGEREYKSSAVRVVPSDSVGAGDSFDAAYIQRFLAGASIQEALEFASVVGAFSTTGEGGIEAFRNPKLLQEFLKENAKGKEGETSETQPRSD